MYSRHYHRRQADIWFDRARKYGEFYCGAFLTAPAIFMMVKGLWLPFFIVATFGAVSISLLLLAGAVNVLKANTRRINGK